MSKKRLELNVPLFVALDVDTKEQCLELAKNVREFVGGFKIGPRLIVQYGESLIRELAAIGPVFVDNKYFDIPTVVEHSLRATFDAGASYATVHAACGPEALKHFSEVEQELNEERFFRVLAVTVLTSFTESNTPPNWVSKPIQKQVMDLADSSYKSGLTGLVCSAHEVKELREKFPAAFLVTPGIRFLNEGQEDQKRVKSPQEAMELGASAIVVGRPIVAAPNPTAAAQSYYKALTEG